MNEPIGLYIMAVMYVFAGLMHFIKPKMYMRIMPKYLPNHKTLVYLSGIAELLLGIGLCIPALWHYCHACQLSFSALLYAFWRKSFSRNPKMGFTITITTSVCAHVLGLDIFKLNAF